MKIEDRLRQELHDTAEHLLVRPDDLERVMRIGRRRKRLTTAGGLAGSLVAVVGVIALASLGPETTPPVGTAPSTLPSPSTTATTAPPGPSLAESKGVVAAGPAGISLLDFASGEATVLASDPGYETISWALSDGAGGLVFVHEITPLPWEQGSIMWLPAGATDPVPLIAPGLGERMIPVDMIDGALTLIFTYEHRDGSELRTLDLQNPSTEPLLTPTEPLQAVAVDGEVMAVVTGTDCLQVDFYNAFGGGPIDVGFQSAGCLPPTNGIGMAGGFLYSLETGAGTTELVVRHLGTGATVDAIDAGNAWQISVGADGVVAFGGETVTVGRFSEGTFEELHQLPAAGTIALTSQLSVAAAATLGSGDASLPCLPMTDLPPLAPQNLPPEVELTRQKLYNLAASCDLTGLAEAAAENGTSLGFGEIGDPLAYLIANARRGFDVANWITRMLNAEPAQREDGGYAWPAVFVTGSEADWEAVSGILTAAEYEQLRQTDDYLGFRVGIDGDGRWGFALAGD
ncbi:MAG TPA: hypothetical protein VM470_05630 [Acidimicrobiia bacterium]|nr:hypothetical protein [Acidimicrobiia bacterium]